MTINVTLNTVGNLQDTTTAETQLNNNSATTAQAFLSALNTQGDKMLGQLDMNSFQIVNLPSPGSANSPLRLADASILNGGGTITTVNLVAGSNIVIAASTISVSTGPVFTSVSSNTLTCSTATMSTLTLLSTLSSINLTTTNANIGVLTASTEVFTGNLTVTGAISSVGNIISQGNIQSGNGQVILGSGGNITANGTGIITATSINLASIAGTGAAAVYRTATGGLSAVSTVVASQVFMSGATAPVWSTAQFPTDVTASGQTLVSVAAHTWTTSLYNPGTNVLFATNININTTTTDNPVVISLPPGFSRYAINQVYLFNASSTATSGTFAVYTGTGASGVNVCTTATYALSSVSDATAGNLQSVTIQNANTEYYTLSGQPNLYFRTITPLGSSGTIAVSITVKPLP